MALNAATLSGGAAQIQGFGDQPITLTIDQIYAGANVNDRVSSEELRKWLDGLNDEDLGRYKM